MRARVENQNDKLDSRKYFLFGDGICVGMRNSARVTGAELKIYPNLFSKPSFYESKESEAGQIVRRVLVSMFL